jgi:non-ribosomal peptide synthetase component F
VSSVATHTPGWNDTSTSYERDASVPELFERSVSRHGDEIAVEAGERRLTYRELEAAANRVAQRLRRLGVCA